MKKKDIILIIIALYACVSALSAQCIERYAVLYSYDVASEEICYKYRDVDWNHSRVSLFAPADYTGDLQSTPLLPTVRAIISKDQYDEIQSYYIDYQEVIRGQSQDIAIEELEIYKLLVNEVLD